MKRPPDIELTKTSCILHTYTPQEGLKDVGGQHLNSASMPLKMILLDDLLSDNIQGSKH